MRIEGVNSGQLQKIYQQQRRLLDRDGAEQQRESGDSMEISAEARQIHNIAREMDEVPEVRSERVQELRQQVQSGNYEVDPEQVAESILAELNELEGEQS